MLHLGQLPFVFVYSVLFRHPTERVEAMEDKAQLREDDEFINKIMHVIFFFLLICLVIYRVELFSFTADFVICFCYSEVKKFLPRELLVTQHNVWEFAVLVTSLVGLQAFPLLPNFFFN